MVSLYKPHMPPKLPELDNILHSGALAYGKWGRKFEKILGDYIGNENVLVVNSYNAAMLVTLTTLDIQAGDEVIASPMSCLASNQPFATQGIKVIWADIDPSTGTLNPDSLASKISKRTKAIFHNHHCGYPGYIDEINAIGKEHGLPVIDDGIEAFGAEYKGKRVGNLGTDITTFSFETVRMPNCISGGAVVFSNKEQFEKAKIIRDYGVNRNGFRDDLGEINPECDIFLPGYGVKISEINSYIGVKQMESIDDLIGHQRSIADKWKDWIKNEYPDCSILSDRLETNPNYWIFGILVLDKRKRIEEMREKGFYASGVHLNNNLYSVFGDKSELPGVSEFYSKFIALPSGWWVNSELIK